jgi:hypothetical protein
VRLLQAEPFRWQVLLELAEKHGVQGILAKRLEEWDYTNVPSEARERLQSRVRAQYLSNLSLTAELFRVLQDFSDERIDLIAVKGPVISQVAYGDPGLRGFGDIDLLLPHREIHRAVERMVALGFVLDRATPVNATTIPGEYRFSRPGTSQLVELHTEKTFRHYRSPMRIEEMLARKRYVQVDGRSVPALSLEDELLFDCVHGGKDFWQRLVWVSDVAALVSRNPEMDWQKVQRVAEDVGASRMLRVGVQLAAELFSGKLPEAMALPIRQDSQVKVLCAQIARWLPYGQEKAPGVAARALYRAKLGGGGITGLVYLLRLTLSPTEDDWESKGAESPSWLWGTLRRPFRLTRKYRSGE